MDLKFPLRENFDLVLVNIFYLWNKLQTQKTVMDIWFGLVVPAYLFA